MLFMSVHKEVKMEQITLTKIVLSDKRKDGTPYISQKTAGQMGVLGYM